MFLPPLRPPPIAEEPRLHRRGRAHARARHRGLHGHVQRRSRGLAATVTVSGCSERLVWIENVGTGGMSARTTRVDSSSKWREQNRFVRDARRVFRLLRLRALHAARITESPGVCAASASRKTFSDVLGVRPLLGRGFADEECVWNGRKAALLSSRVLATHFDGDRSVVGSCPSRSNGEPTPRSWACCRPRSISILFSRRGARWRRSLPFPLRQRPRAGATRSSPSDD